MRASLKSLPITFLLSGVLASADVAAASELLDSAGRRIAAPDSVERVFAAGPPASIVLFTLAPGRLLGWTSAQGARRR